jgi:hypothetical protein
MYVTFLVPKRYNPGWPHRKPAENPMLAMLRIVAIVVVTLALNTVSGLTAARAETPDPATMNADERRAAYESMNDAERVEFRRKMREYYENMTPQAREAARQEAQERFANMTPEERAAAKQRAQELFESLTPEERELAKQKARERFENMTPEERAAMKEKIKARRLSKSQ